jgi:hypothetical protein
MSDIILITDVLAHRKTKQAELAFYSERLAELEHKVLGLRLEIDLTNRILLMIRKEQVVKIL